MNYAEELAHKLVDGDYVNLEMTEMALIAIIIEYAKKEIDPKTLRYWLITDDDFLSDAVSACSELLKTK
jgi:hypothetical protein